MQSEKLKEMKEKLKKMNETVRDNDMLCFLALYDPQTDTWYHESTVSDEIEMPDEHREEADMRIKEYLKIVIGFSRKDYSFNTPSFRSSHT